MRFISTALLAMVGFVFASCVTGETDIAPSDSETDDGDSAVGGDADADGDADTDADTDTDVTTNLSMKASALPRQLI